MWGTLYNPQCFKEKNYKTKLSTSSIWKKNKFEKENYGKKNKKNHAGKHCSNQQCFKEKTITLNSQPAQY
jgi:hypothetical protein